MFHQNSFANDDEFVFLFQPVFVRRKDIQQMPSMAMPVAPAPMPVEAQPEVPALPTIRKKYDLKINSDKMSEPATSGQINYVVSLAKKNGIPETAILEEFGVSKLEELNKAEAGEFIRRYKDSKPFAKSDKSSIW